MGEEGVELFERQGTMGAGAVLAKTLAKGGAAFQTWRIRALFMSSSSSPPQAPLPTWMRRTGAALTALVSVLFVVVLLQVRQQGERIQKLQDQVQTLENANDLDRTNALEEQVRSTAERLQDLEGLNQAVQSLRSEQAGLRAQLRSAQREPQFPLDDGLGPSGRSTTPRPGRLPTLPPLPSGQP